MSSKVECITACCAQKDAMILALSERATVQAELLSKRAERKTWEYASHRTPFTTAHDAFLKQYADDGWRLAAVDDGIHYFEREVTS